MSRRRHPDIDAAVGKQIRNARGLVGLSQGELGDRLDVSYQQVQKYEGGRDSLSVGMLLHVAATLQVPASTLLDIDGARDIPDRLSETRQALKLGRLLQSIPDAQVRRDMIASVEAAAGASPPALAAE